MLPTGSVHPIPIASCKMDIKTGTEAMITGKAFQRGSTLDLKLATPNNSQPPVKAGTPINQAHPAALGKGTTRKATAINPTPMEAMTRPILPKGPEPARV